MLVERKYPFTVDLMKKMLKCKLEVKQRSSAGIFIVQILLRRIELAEEAKDDDDLSDH